MPTPTLSIKLPVVLFITVVPSPNAPVVPLIAPELVRLVSVPTLVMFGCAAVVTVPAVVAVDALPDSAPENVVAVTVPPLDELVPLLKFVAVVAVAALPVVLWLNVGQVKLPLLKLPDAGVPRAGVTRLGFV